MSSFKDKFEKARLRRQEKYIKMKKNEELLEKIGNLISINKTNRSAYRITRYAKKYFLKPVINIDPNIIPGIFRKRLCFNDDNKIKPFPNLKYNNNINISNLSFNDKFEKGRQLREYKYLKKNNDILNESICDDEFFDEDINKAIIESLKKYDDSDNNTNNNKNNYWICIDLRVYGPEPTKPIYIDDTKYYLNNSQIDQINKLWNKINPSTSRGIRFHQDLKFFKIN